MRQKKNQNTERDEEEEDIVRNRALYTEKKENTEKAKEGTLSHAIISLSHVLMMIDLYLSQSGVVVWNYSMLMVVVAFDGHLWKFADRHLEEKK